MKFSIIIPLYNKAAYIGEVVESVLAQSFQDFELVVVDDCSTDNSAEIVTSYNDKRIRLLKKSNGGVSSARNYGIRNSTGDIVCFLDADDLWRPNYLEELDKTVELFPEVGFYCGAFDCFVNNRNNIVRHVNLNLKKTSSRCVVDYLEKSVENFGSIALTSTVAVKRDLLNTMEYWFKEGKCIGEDNDLWVRIALKSKVVYNNTSLMLYRSFAEGGLTASKYNYENSINYWDWYSLSKNQMLHLFATQMIYSLARNCYKRKLYDDAILCLSQIKGFKYLCRRISLRIMAFIFKNKYL